MTDERGGPEPTDDRPAPADDVGDQFALIYHELRRLARHIRGGRSGDTLVTTALVNEAYVKLASSPSFAARDREHFLALAARAMRQILVDAARRRGAQKRGGLAVTLHEGLASTAAPMDTDDLLALDEALHRLERIDARRARVVEHRLFAGLTPDETAAVLGVSRPTVDRDWRAARAWLAVQLAEER